MTNPGKQSSALETAVGLHIHAVDASPTETLAYHGAGLPAGLTISRTSGVISGVPTARGRSHVTVSVSDSVDTASVSFVWTVKRH